MDREAWWATVYRVTKKLDTTERLLLSYREEQPKKKKTFAFIVSLIKTTVIQSLLTDGEIVKNIIDYYTTP